MTPNNYNHNFMAIKHTSFHRASLSPQSGDDGAQCAKNHCHDTAVVGCPWCFGWGCEAVEGDKRGLKLRERGWDAGAREEGELLLCSFPWLVFSHKYFSLLL